jgi:predicted nucleic acid-binding protein
MALIISDANIFIDLDCAALTARMFRLGYDFATPGPLYEDELSQHHPELPALGLQVRPLEGHLIGRSVVIRQAYPGLSIYDVFALVLANHEAVPLLTGDGRLRSAARAERVEVCGTLWLMEQMFCQRLLTFDEMESAYDAMIQAQRRLPQAKIRSQLERLGRSNR